MPFSDAFVWNYDGVEDDSDAFENGPIVVVVVVVVVVTVAVVVIAAFLLLFTLFDLMNTILFISLFF
jgi:hypothetical protein